MRENAKADQYPDDDNGLGGLDARWAPTGERLLSGAFSPRQPEADRLADGLGGRPFRLFRVQGEGYLAQIPGRSLEARFSPNADVVLQPVPGAAILWAVQGRLSVRRVCGKSHWHYEGSLVNNPDLRPEISKNKEVGVNLLRNDVITPGDKLRVKLSYFDNHYDDYIFRGLRSSRGGANVYHWINMASANYRGYEASGGYDAGVAFVEGAYTKYESIQKIAPRQPHARRRRNSGPTSEPT